MVEGEGGRRRRRVVFDGESGSEGDVESEEEGEEEEGGEWRLLACTKQKARGSSGRRRRETREKEQKGEEGSSSEEEEEEGRRVRVDSSSEGEYSSEERCGFLDDEAEEGESEDVMDWESEEEEEDDSFVLHEAVEKRSKRKIVETSTDEEGEEGEGSEELEDEEEDSEEEKMEGVKTPGRLQWKEGLVERAREAFERRRLGSASLRNLIYSDAALAEGEEEGGDSGDELGGLFHVAKKRSISTFHREDHSLPRPSFTHDWSDPEVADAVKSLFVTGSWGAEDARAVLDMEEEEVDGDFEDLETGETHQAEQRG